MTDQDTGAEDLGRLVEQMQASTLFGDIRDVLLDELQRNKDPKPWNERSEAEQNQLLLRVGNISQQLVHQVVRVVAADGRRSLPATIEKIVIKGGIQVLLSIDSEEELRHALFDAEGQRIQISLADTHPFEGERRERRATPDQGDLEEAMDGEDEDFDEEEVGDTVDGGEDGDFEEDEPEGEAPAETPPAPDVPSPPPAESPPAAPATAAPRHPAGQLSTFWAFFQDQGGIDKLNGWNLVVVDEHTLEVRDGNGHEVGITLVAQSNGLIVQKGKWHATGQAKNKGWKAIKAVFEDYNKEIETEAFEGEQDAAQEPQEGQPAAEQAPAKPAQVEAAPAPAGDVASGPQEDAAPTSLADIPPALDRRPKAEGNGGAPAQADAGAELDAKALKEINENGEQSYLENVAFEMNPFTPDTDPAAAWANGWLRGAQADGGEAFKKGEQVMLNPFSADSPPWHAWNKGWMDAWKGQHEAPPAA